MLYLREPKQSDLNEYLKKIKKPVLKNINDSNKNSFLNNEAKDFIKVKFDEIIQARPEELKELNEAFFKILNKGLLKYKHYERYLIIKNSNQNEINLFDKIFIKFYLKQLKKIEQIFDYETILSKSKSKSYWLSKKMGVNTCVYCNRLYANVIDVNGGTNDDKRIARPFFDHWYPKSKYPILSLSFYNLIPSCFVCNSSIKGSKEFDLKTHLHPYVKKNGTNFKFSYEYNYKGEPKVVIRDIKNLNDKTINSIKDFKLEEVYNSHSHLELKDLIDLANKYPDKYLDNLFNQTFKDLKMSEEEIYRMIFGIEIHEEEYHKRPFSKFKHDIILELKQIK